MKQMTELDKFRLSKQLKSILNSNLYDLKHFARVYYVSEDEKFLGYKKKIEDCFNSIINYLDNELKKQ